MPPASGKPKRILFCTTRYYPESTDGATHQAQLQAEELTRRGHSVTVVCPTQNRPRRETINGVRVDRLPGSKLGGMATYIYISCLAVYLLCQTRRHDLIHVHLASFQSHIVAAVTALLQRPYMVKLGAGGDVAGDVARMARRGRLTRFIGLRRASFIQALSQEIHDELRSIGIPESKIARIPNGYDAAVFHPVADSAPHRASLNLPADKVIVLFTGRFSRFKGLLDLLESWRADPPPGAVLVLVGTYQTGPVIPTIEPGDDLIVRGWTLQIQDYLHAADVYVSPSHAEGMSNSVLEAMAAGLPVIATRVGAAEAMIEDGVSGLLIPPREVAALTHALHRLVADPTLRRSLATQAAKDAAQRYSIASVVDHLEALYDRMIQTEVSR